MESNTVTRAAKTSLELAPVPAEQSVSGAPSTATLPLGTFGPHEFGIWEMSPGTMTDIEAEELFVVLVGAATIEFDDGSPMLHIGPGDVVRLAEGARTVWTVTETLRKVYLA